MNNFNTSPLIYDTNRPREECGVFAVFQHFNDKEEIIERAAELTVLGLQALQHRGQEACGIVTFTKSNPKKDEIVPMAIRKLGMVSTTFCDTSITEKMRGYIAIGHTRYATRGHKDDIDATQPFVRLTPLGSFALAHNGQFTNSQDIRRHLAKDNRAFNERSDTLALVETIAANKQSSLSARIKNGVLAMKGAYALVLATSKQVIGIRDPYGIRPLILGWIPQCNTHILASESCALDIVGAEIVRDIAPGEMIIIDNNGIQSQFLAPQSKKARTCIFEYVYFARPDSIIDNIHVYQARINMGQQLAKQELQTLNIANYNKNIEKSRNALRGDIVISVPDSGNPAAMGFAKGLGIDYEMGIIRNHYTGRSFIEPDPQSRITKVKIKHNPNTSVIAGKRIYVIDDSIVRGNTSINIVKMLRTAGAIEVHLRISCPQVLYNCCYGIDIPDRETLISVTYNGNTIKMAEVLGVDSLDFLSIDGMYRALGQNCRNHTEPQFTDHYFTGDYPITPNSEVDTLII